MTRPSRRSGRLHRRPVVMLAGWLFADLMLVIMVVMMASQPDPLANAKAVVTHRPTPSPSPSRSAGPRTLNLKPVVIHVDGPSVAQAKIVSEIQAELAGYVGRQAGMVLVFGDGVCIGPDTAYAKTVIGLLNRANPNADPPMFPATTVTRPFINGGSGGSCSGDPATGADLDIYYFTSAS